MNLLEDTIQKVERLYENVTGKDFNAKEATHEPISAEIDPYLLLDVRMNQLLSLLESPATQMMLRPSIPPMSAWENENLYLLRFDIPGVEKSDIDITVRGAYLIINARRKPLTQDSGMQPRLIEATSGQYHREVLLPKENLTSEISSNLVNGVLEISIPKVSTTSKGTSSKKSKAQ
ncbi:MAG: Hsp20/alpha crystallin family protein [Bdellovibrionales bacterium]|nr:Hsp20/alpha crystallin family protein [Bdellovibrionales bacterium]